MGRDRTGEWRVVVVQVKDYVERTKAKFPVPLQRSRSYDSVPDPVPLHLALEERVDLESQDPLGKMSVKEQEVQFPLGSEPPPSGEADGGVER